ncbi:MoaD/ThiS family protein [Microcoleus sp. AR_TQ3_B6]|uniref:MoaD/ThiS family protein n=1 Tax=Microcoleus sp. AR_TQ3_B6 TaxID=3055284 RepID=UPI002FD43418
MSNSSITITLKLFAAFGEAYGVSELKLELPPDTPVSQVLESSIAQYPQLEQWRSRTRFGLNMEFVSPDTILQDGDEVVLIPPVSGG